MPYVADLHIHSRFARACSRDLNIPNLSKWAKYKGIDLVGTGDCLHPIWQIELKKDLKEKGDGTYEFDGTKFIFTTEVACIYSENGRVYRIHIIILLPSLDSVQKLSEALTKKGINLASDGRPIMGMSSKNLCGLVFGVEPKALIIPAHIWTPWFSLYGANSGYNKIADCFGEFTGQIYAVETGLSSEPAMNWRIGDLDNKSIVSFSDLHSLPRMGREVTIFGGGITFKGLCEALKGQNIIGTIEFFPEEGKYHYSGHRNCNIVYGPEELKEKGNPSTSSGQWICPVCKRPLTIGVMQRVEELATREIKDLRLTVEGGITKSDAFPDRPGFRMLVQLEEIIAEAFSTGVASQKVKNEYIKLVTTVDPELKLLTKTSLDLIAMASGDRVAEGIGRVRDGKLKIEPGYDNTYGVVKIWDGEEEKKAGEEQISLF
ncbi:DNA helicase UvrD [Candidatus Daviesbacteria bacterium]|nr:DNA helicase UvrD [Candidatus Daviesbacteria bacterium]